MPPSVLLNATADELKWWLSIPIEVATQLIAAAEAAPDTVNLAGLAGLIASACAAAGDAGERVEVEAVCLRFAAEDECEEYLRQVLELLPVVVVVSQSMLRPCCHLGEFFCVSRRILARRRS